MKKLSPRQQSIFDFIAQFIQNHQYPPSVRDIQNGCNISSTSVVDYNLRILQREGYLRREAEVSRGIELLQETSLSQNRNYINVPVLGNIAAGEPLGIPPSETWHSNSIDNVELPPFLIQDKKEVFALRVKGESMIDALVADGDLVLMEPIDNPNNGDMVAAMLKDKEEVTLKHFYIQDGTVTLQPANSSMEAIKVPAENISVQGRVVGGIRSI